MATQIQLTDKDVYERIKCIDVVTNSVYCIPSGGMCAGTYLKHARIVNNINEADVILDDIRDSGRTMELIQSRHPELTATWHFVVDKKTPNYLWDENDWIVFPWDMRHPKGSSGGEDCIVRLLQYIGENPEREGIIETPKRVLKAFKEMTDGYNKNPEEVLEKRFKCEHDDLVIVKNIYFTSLCEHHMLPFTGYATIGYIPKKEVVGLSKLARLVDVFAHRLQIQEQLTQQIADALQEALDPKGIGVVINAGHHCMSCRGVRRHESTTVTSAMRGVLLDKHEARAEFMQLIK